MANKIHDVIYNQLTTNKTESGLPLFNGTREDFNNILESSPKAIYMAVKNGKGENGKNLFAGTEEEFYSVMGIGGAKQNVDLSGLGVNPDSVKSITQEIDSIKFNSTTTANPLDTLNKTGKNVGISSSVEQAIAKPNAQAQAKQIWENIGTSDAYSIENIKATVDDETWNALVSLASEEKANHDNAIRNEVATRYYGTSAPETREREIQTQKALAQNPYEKEKFVAELQSQHSGRYVPAVTKEVEDAKNRLNDLGYKQEVTTNNYGNWGEFYFVDKNGVRISPKQAQYYTNASKLIKDTEEVLNAPSRSDNSKGIVNFGKGIAERATDEEFWLPMLTVAKNMNIGEVAKKMNEGKELTPEESILLESYINYGLAQQARQYDMSKGYMAGQGTAESVMFMLEMAIGGKIASGTGKLLSSAGKKFANKFANKAIGKATGKVVNTLTKFAASENKLAQAGKAVAEAVIEPAFMASNYKNISQQYADEHVFGDKKFGVVDATSAWLDTSKEILTEKAGEGLSFIGAKGWNKIKATKYGKWIDSPMMKQLRNLYKGNGSMNLFMGMMQNPLSEIGEEYIGGMMDFVRSYNPLLDDDRKKELREGATSMFTAEGLGDTALMVAPLSFIFGGVSFVKGANATRNFSKAKDKLTEELFRQGLNEEQVAQIILKLDSTDDIEERKKIFAQLSDAILQQWGDRNPSTTQEEKQLFENKIHSTLEYYLMSSQAFNDMVAKITDNYNELKEDEKKSVDKAFETYTEEFFKRKQEEAKARNEERKVTEMAEEQVAEQLFEETVQEVEEVVPDEDAPQTEIYDEKKGYYITKEGDNISITSQDGQLLKLSNKSEANSIVKNLNENFEGEVEFEVIKDSSGVTPKFSIVSKPKTQEVVTTEVTEENVENSEGKVTESVEDNKEITPGSVENVGETQGEDVETDGNSKEIERNKEEIEEEKAEEIAEQMLQEAITETNEVTGTEDVKQPTIVYYRGKQHELLSPTTEDGSIIVEDNLVRIKEVGKDRTKAVRPENVYNDAKFSEVAKIYPPKSNAEKTRKVKPLDYQNTEVDANDVADAFLREYGVEDTIEALQEMYSEALEKTQSAKGLAKAEAKKELRRLEEVANAISEKTNVVVNLQNNTVEEVVEDTEEVVEEPQMDVSEVVVGGNPVEVTETETTEEVPTNEEGTNETTYTEETGVPTYQERILENGDKEITVFNSLYETTNISIERNGKIIYTDTYQDGVLFERTEFDDNGYATFVTRYSKTGQPMIKYQYENGVMIGQVPITKVENETEPTTTSVEEKTEGLNNVESTKNDEYKYVKKINLDDNVGDKGNTFDKIDEILQKFTTKTKINNINQLEEYESIVDNFNEDTTFREAYRIVVDSINKLSSLGIKLSKEDFLTIQSNIIKPCEKAGIEKRRINYEVEDSLSEKESDNSNEPIPTQKEIDSYPITDFTLYFKSPTQKKDYGLSNNKLYIAYEINDRFFVVINNEGKRVLIDRVKDEKFSKEELKQGTIMYYKPDGGELNTEQPYLVMNANEEQKEGPKNLYPLFEDNKLRRLDASRLYVRNQVTGEYNVYYEGPKQRREREIKEAIEEFDKLPENERDDAFSGLVNEYIDGINNRLKESKRTGDKLGSYDTEFTGATNLGFGQSDKGIVTALNEKIEVLNAIAKKYGYHQIGTMKTKFGNDGIPRFLNLLNGYIKNPKDAEALKFFVFESNNINNIADEADFKALTSVTEQVKYIEDRIDKIKEDLSFLGLKLGRGEKPLANLLTKLKSGEKRLMKATSNTEVSDKQQVNNQFADLDNSENSSNFVEDNFNFNEEQYDLRQRGQSLVSKRFTPEERKGFEEGNRILENATYLVGGSQSTSGEIKEQDPFEREEQRRETQEQILEDWAKANNLWIENTESQLSEEYEYLTEGGEADVYLDAENNRVIKAIGLDYYVSPQLALDRIVLHNYLFGDETLLNIKGFGRNSEGYFKIIVEQPYIKGESLSYDEIESYIENLGFPVRNRGNWTYANEDIYISDLHDENVIRTPEGNIAVIDADIRINTPELKNGGTRETEIKIDEERKAIPSAIADVYANEYWYSNAAKRFEQSLDVLFAGGVRVVSQEAIDKILNLNKPIAVTQKNVDILKQWIGGVDIEVVKPNHKDRALYDGAFGWYDLANKRVVVVEGAPISVVLHEVGWHATLDWAKTNDTKMYEKMLQIASEAPADIRFDIVSKYGELSEEAFLDELGAEMFTRAAQKKLYEYITTQEARRWWQKMFDAFDKLFKKARLKIFRQPIKSKKIDFEAMEKMNSVDFLNSLADTMIKGEVLGKWTEEDKEEAKRTNNGIRWDKEANDYTPEMEEIKAQAIANGTFMKAPNGKPTNLTERQWLHVRTDAFKKWFGDWLKTARIEKLRESEPIVVEFNNEYELNRDSAKQWMKNNLRGEYVNNDTGEKIVVSKVGINEVTSHGSKDKAHLLSLVAIPQLIEKSIFIDEQANAKDNDKYESYKYYVCGARINNEDYTIKIVVGIKDGAKYYDHRLTQIEKGKLIDNLNGLSNSVAENQNTLSEYKDTKLISILQTNSSKVVDANGEPKVVYHGSSWNPLAEEDSKAVFSKTDIKDGGHFFTDKKEMAESYKGGIITKVFLNIRNPKEVKVNNFWNKINANKFNIEEIKDVTIKKSRGGGFFIGYIQNGEQKYTNFLPYNLSEQFGDETLKHIEDFLASDNKEIKLETFQLKVPRASNTRELVADAKQEGRDGVIFNNILDYGSNVKAFGEDMVKHILGGGVDNTVYVAFEPTQIKSATNNVGTYDSNNPDIRYMASGSNIYGVQQGDELFVNITPEQKIGECADLWLEQLRQSNPRAYELVFGEGENPNLMSDLMAIVRDKLKGLVDAEEIDLSDEVLREMTFEEFMTFADALENLNMQNVSKSITRVQESMEKFEAMLSAESPTSGKAKEALERWWAAAMDDGLPITRMLQGLNAHLIKEGLPKLDSRYDIANLRNLAQSKSKFFIEKFRDRGEFADFIKQAKALDAIIVNNETLKDLADKLALDRVNSDKEALQSLVEVYMLAKDNIERRNMDLPCTSNDAWLESTGMADVEFVEIFESEFTTKQLADFWRAKNKATNVSLDFLLDYGILSQAQYDKFKERQYYVPQRGFDNIELEEDNNIPSNRSVPNPKSVQALYKAGGRDTMATSPIAQILLITDNAIRTSLNNEYRKAMLDLVRMYPAYFIDEATGKSMVDYSSAWEEVTFDEHGNKEINYVAFRDEELVKEDKEAEHNISVMEEKIKELNMEMGKEKRKKNPDTDLIKSLEEEVKKLKEGIVYANDHMHYRRVYDEKKGEEAKAHQVFVKDNGGDYVLTFEDKRIANALNNLHFDQAGAVGFIKKMNRYTSNIYTTYNPAFGFKNFARDIMQIILNGFSQYGWKFLGHASKNVLTCLPKGFFNIASYLNKSNIKFDEDFEEFLSSGAMTGYVYSMSLEDYRNNVKSILQGDYYEVGELTKKGREKMKDTLKFITEFSELYVRYVAFRTSRDLGYSKHQSAVTAKNLGVNFDKRGSGFGKGSGYKAGKPTGNDNSVIWQLIDVVNNNMSFSRASMRGMASLYEPLLFGDKKTRKNTRWMLGGIAIFGVFEGLLYAFSSDDDEDKDRLIREKVGAWDRHSNTMWWVDDTTWYGKIGKNFGSITQNFIPFYTTGFELSRLLYNTCFNKAYKINIEEAALNFGYNVYSEITNYAIPLPPTITEFVKTSIDAAVTLDGEKAKMLIPIITPTVWKPIAEFGFNVDYLGNKVYYPMRTNKVDSEYSNFNYGFLWEDEYGRKNKYILKDGDMKKYVNPELGVIFVNHFLESYLPKPIVDAKDLALDKISEANGVIIEKPENKDAKYDLQVRRASYRYIRDLVQMFEGVVTDSKSGAKNLDVDREYIINELVKLHGSEIANIYIDAKKAQETYETTDVDKFKKEHFGKKYNRVSDEEMQNTSGLNPEYMRKNQDKAVDMCKDIYIRLLQYKGDYEALTKQAKKNVIHQ